MKTSVINNTFWILLGSAFNKASSILLLFVLSRYLGASDFGLFSFAFFYSALLSALVEMGITPVVIRHMKTRPDQAGAAQYNGLVLGALALASTLSLSLAGTYVLGLEPGERALAMLACVGLVISFRDMTFRWFLEVPFRAGLEMKTPVLLGIFSEFSGVALVLLAVRFGFGVSALLAIYVLSNFPGFIALAILSLKKLRPKKGEAAGLAQTAREAAPIGLSNILGTVYLMSGSIILFKLSGAESAGYFALAFRLTTSLRIIPEALMHSVFPLMAKAGADRDTLDGLFRKSMGYTAMLAFPVAFGIMALSDKIAALAGGDGFAPAGGAMDILVWATAFAFINTVVRFTFNAVSLQDRNLRIAFFMAALSLGLSVMLIERAGLAGAAYALTITEAAGLALSVEAAYASGLRFPLGLIGKSFLASAVMAACIWSLPYMALQIMAGLVVYSIAGVALGNADLRIFLRGRVRSLFR